MVDFIDEIMEQNGLKGERTKLFLEAVFKTTRDAINEMTKDIMTMKSFSYGEALLLAQKMFEKGILPKSKDFYKIMKNIKTAWEY